MSYLRENILWLGLSGLLAFFVAILVRRWHVKLLPAINAYPNDFFHKKAHGEYMTGARRLIANGFKKFSNGPFRILTPIGARTILPPSYANWVKSTASLSHPELVKHEYLSWIPGFEGNSIIHEPHHIIVDVTRNKLSQNADSIPVMHKHLVEVLTSTWAASPTTWHPASLAETSMTLISTAASAVFAGPVLSRDPAWQHLTKTYTMNMFLAVRKLRAWPAALRPLVHWFISECRACRAQVALARRKVHAELARREAAGEAHDDVLTWIADAAAQRRLRVDPAEAQLAFAIAALHTTTQLLQQTLLNLCAHPALLEPLRAEVAEALRDGGGWTLKALARMELLDSCIKETQRLKPGSLVNLERMATADVVMPNGATLRRGTSVAVDTAVMWDAEVFPQPDVYDGARFLRMRQEGGKGAGAAQLVSSSVEHFAFGLGKSICPGRFMVANEIKVVLAELLLGWDIRLQEGTDVGVVEWGFEMLSAPGATIEVRQREKE